MADQKLPIHDMAERHRGLTAAVADCYLEAARVCLDRHHSSPVEFTIENSVETIGVATEWDSTDARTRDAWANEIDATEAGAYACALAAAELTDGFLAIRRAETKTGADYYIAPVGEPAEDLESCVRLEVSGLNRGEISAVRQRLKEKLAQAKAGASNLPAMAGVVGFEARVILLSKVVEP